MGTECVSQIVKPTTPAAHHGSIKTTSATGRSKSSFSWQEGGNKHQRWSGNQQYTSPRELDKYS